jgi:DnaJ-domain-containing protein 1
MRAKVQHALLDGKVSEVERSELESLARELGYSKDALDRLIEIQDTYREGVTKCPHCGHTLEQDARKSGDQTEL